MRREVTLLEALLVIILAPFYFVFWIVSRVIAWFVVIGLFVVVAVLSAVAFFVNLFMGDK